MDLNDILAEVEGVGDAFVTTPAIPTPERMTTGPREVPVNSEPNEQALQHIALQSQGDNTPPIVTPDTPLGAMEMVLDVELGLVVELGNVMLTVQELMTLAPGHELLLDRLPADPCRIFVNEELVAYGEPLIVDGELAVKVTELITSRSGG